MLGVTWSWEGRACTEVGMRVDDALVDAGKRRATQCNSEHLSVLGNMGGVVLDFILCKRWRTWPRF